MSSPPHIVHNGEHRVVKTIYSERKENRYLADGGFWILLIVCVGYALLLAAYLFTFLTTGPTTTNPLAWWIAILLITASTLACFLLLALYLHNLSHYEIPFEAKRSWMLLAAAACMAIRCVADSLTHASGAVRTPGGPFAFFLDGSADRFLGLAGMTVFSFCIASILNYCSMLQDDADTID